MNNYGKYIVLSSIVLTSSFGCGSCSEIYQKAMLDEESRTSLARTFTNPIIKSGQTAGILVYSEEELHMTLNKATAPSKLKSKLESGDVSEMQDAYQFMNGGLKQSVDRAQQALQDIPIEKITLSKALHLVFGDHVFVAGNKTVIFE